MSGLSWRAPALRTDEDEDRERKTSFLELFFDLAVVAVVARLAHGLVADPSWPALGRFAAAFVFLWWAWNGVVYYNERFESPDASHMLAMFLLVIPAAVMAWAAHDPLGSEVAAWVLGYVGIRGLLWVLYARAAFHNPAFRPVARVFLALFGLAQIVLLVSLAVPAPARFAMWGAALLLELAAPPLTLGMQRALPRLSRSHLPERYGLFVLIALGETVVGVVNAMDARHGTGPLAWIVVPLALWCIYFQGLFERPLRPTLPAFAGWIYGHAPLLLAVAAVGPSITLAATGERLGAAWLAGSVAVFVTALWLLRGVTLDAAMHREERG